MSGDCCGTLSSPADQSEYAADLHKHRRGGDVLLDAVHARKVPLAALAGPLALTAAVVAVVSTFAIDVTDRELVLAFGLGLFRRRVPLSDIVRVERTAVPW
ncbi:MAG: hypothetical protein V7604_907 [Hyphomicrobiales bacterium]|jgi:hypothetical protein